MKRDDDDDDDDNNNDDDDDDNFGWWESVKSGHHCCPCQAPPPPVLVTTSPSARIIRQSSQPEASACCCSGCCCNLHAGIAPSAASLRQLREPGDGIAGIAADSLRINGGIRQFRQIYGNKKAKYEENDDYDLQQQKIQNIQDIRINIKSTYTIR
ncbi:hypothetical protein M0804_008606 [Polistes exclamans]|nr:hypothetical protein M0804_008606 [Polistes exclamans]